MRVCLPLRALRATAFACALGGAASTVVADDWQFNPKVQLGSEYNNNYRLLASPNQDEVYGFFTNAAFQIRYLTQVDDVSITPAVYGIVLPDSREDNTADPSVVFNWNRVAPTYKAGLYAQYLDQAVVVANDTTAGTIGNQLGNPTQGDTGQNAINGLITERERRKLAEATPTLTVDLTQRRHLEVSADITNITYSANLPGFSVGYTAINGSVGIIEDLTQRTSLAVRALVTQYDPQDGFDSSTSFGGVGEWDFHTSQVSQAYIRVGAEHTDFSAGTNATLAPASPPITSVVAGAGMNWTYQVTQIFLDVTRTVEPNGTGFTVDRDQLRLSLQRNLSARLIGVVGARLDRDVPTAPTTEFAARDYAVGYLQAKWRFLREWTLGGEYDYTFQHFGTLASDPPVPAFSERSNAVMITVTWEPNRVN